MARNAKQILVAAAHLFSIGTIVTAAKSPELQRELLAFGFDNVCDLDVDWLKDDTSQLDNGPASVLGIELADENNAEEVDRIVGEHESAIVDNLGPLVATVEKMLGIKA